MWENIENQLKQHDVSIQWVKGHADNKYNNIADELAVNASKKTNSFQIDQFYEDGAGLNFG
jgi:ribonuclease HI